MGDDRTYEEWPKLVETATKYMCDGKHLKWDDVFDTYQRVSKLMNYDDNDDSVKGHIMKKVYNSVIGLEPMIETMAIWQYAVKEIYGMYMDKDGDYKHMFECQNIMLLLFTMMAIYDGPYKNIINLLYDGFNGQKPRTRSIEKRANHIASICGIDIHDDMRPDIRNAAAHVSFYPNIKQGTVTIRFTDKNGTVKSIDPYTREQLVSIYYKANNAAGLLYCSVHHWWLLEGSPDQMFDDSFYRDKKGADVRRTAIALMKENLNMKSWRWVVEYARRELVTEPD